jgi:rare lipoprotein A
MGIAESADRPAYAPLVAGTSICGIRLLCALLTVGIVGCATHVQPPPPPPPPIAAPPAIVGTASWYGPGFNGHRTSSGVIYNQSDLTAASTLFPLGTRLLVTNLSDGRSVEVVVNDHGPFVKDRAIDLSERAARMLGMIGPGTARVRMEVLATPPGGPALGQRYFVQVGSYSDPSNARRVQQQFAARYTDVRIEEARGVDSSHYRVRMGAFTTRQAAEERAAYVSHFGYPIVIISE